jgi:mRNA interferase RelE/StbE
MSDVRFDVRFDADAYKEYMKLDKSVAEMVDRALGDLETRADEVGKVLTNRHSTKLHGCREIKLRDAGIRIVFRVTNETVDVLRIVYVLTIEKRADDVAFQVADKRLRRFKVRSNLQTHLAQSRKWEQRRDRHPKDKG